MYLALMLCKCNVKACLDIPISKFLNLFSLGLSQENSLRQKLEPFNQNYSINSKLPRSQ